MGGVNTAVDYYQTTMGFAHPGPDGPVIDKTLLQGGIVCSRFGRPKVGFF